MRAILYLLTLGLSVCIEDCLIGVCFHSFFGPWRGIDLASLDPVRTGEGLGQICADCFGVRLNKELQCSDWAQRPLTTLQVQYAALDAWILLPLLGGLLLRTCGSKMQSVSMAPSCVEDARVPAPLATAACRRFQAPNSSGAACVAAALTRLGADHDARARLVSTGDTLARERAEACKTVACIATPGIARERRLALCLLPLAAELDLDKVIAALGSQSVANVRLASAEELRAHFRQPRGCVGPVGPALLEGAAVLLERSLAQFPLLECGAGSPLWQLHIEPGYLCQMTAGIVADTVVLE